MPTKKSTPKSAVARVKKSSTSPTAKKAASKKPEPKKELTIKKVDESIPAEDILSKGLLEKQPPNPQRGEEGQYFTNKVIIRKELWESKSIIFYCRHYSN